MLKMFEKMKEKPEYPSNSYHMISRDYILCPFRTR